VRGRCKPVCAQWGATGGLTCACKVNLVDLVGYGSIVNETFFVAFHRGILAITAKKRPAKFGFKSAYVESSF